MGARHVGGKGEPGAVEGGKISLYHRHLKEAVITSPL